MPASLDQLLAFVDLLQQYRTIERKVLIKGSTRRENDVEHSYSLAMLAWYLNETHQCGLDTGKLLGYALAHDLVEVYAGDTPFYHGDAERVASKHEKEAAAALRLQEEFPECTTLHAAIDAYEKREDPESRFIYALDKIEPVLSIYRDGGRTWRDDHVTLEMLTSMKRPKVALDATVEKVFEELVALLEKDQDALFNF